MDQPKMPKNRKKREKHMLPAQHDYVMRGVSFLMTHGDGAHARPLTQSEIADAAGVSQQTISKWLAGSNGPSWGIVNLLAKQWPQVISLEKLYALGTKAQQRAPQPPPPPVPEVVAKLPRPSGERPTPAGRQRAGEVLSEVIGLLVEDGFNESAAETAAIRALAGGARDTLTLYRQAIRLANGPDSAAGKR